MVNPSDRPVFIGSVAVDTLHSGLSGEALPPVTLRWGGAVSNMACAVATLGAEPLFISVTYGGEFRWAVPNHLASNGVTWLPLAATAQLPFFHAEVAANGEVTAEKFIGEDALTMLTPEALAPWQDVIVNSSVVVTCTDLEVPTLRWLRSITRAKNVPLWLVSSALTEVHKLSIDGDPSDLSAMNYAELTKRNGTPPLSLTAILKAAAEITTQDGRCLITLGKYGALLVSLDKHSIYYQPAPLIIVGSTTLGAGDIFAGCLLAARLVGSSWDFALRDATARTTGYLRSRGAYTTRPYQLLLSDSVETPLGKVCDDESLRFLAAADIS